MRITTEETIKIYNIKLTENELVALRVIMNSLKGTGYSNSTTTVLVNFIKLLESTGVN